MRKLLPIILIPLLMPFQAFAAISFDAAAGAVSNNSSTQGINLTVGSGSNGLVVICFNTNNTVSSVTFNGVAATSAITPTAGQFGLTEYIYYLVNPSSGTQNASVTVSSGNIQSITAASYFGVDQSTPIDATGDTGGGGPAATFSGSVTTVTANAWPVMCHDGAGGAPVASALAGANTTVRATGFSTGSQIIYSHADSNAGVSVGSNTLNINQQDAVSYWIRSTIALRPSASAPVKVFNPMRIILFGDW